MCVKVLTIIGTICSLQFLLNASISLFAVKKLHFRIYGFATYQIATLKLLQNNIKMNLKIYCFC